MPHQQRNSPTTRRDFLKAAAAATLASQAAGRLQAFAANAGSSAEPNDPIAGITHSIIWEGRRSDANWAWFHPRACMVPGADRPKAVMTMQSISGSDYFGPVHWSTSDDLGTRWTEPQPIPRLGRHPIGGAMEEGVCDCSPDYHPQTGTVLAIGHNVYYKAGRLARPQGPRHPVYTVLGGDGRWSKPQALAWDDPRGSAIYTSNCGQRIMLPGGDVLIPLSFGPKGRPDRTVSSALCSFDGRTMTVKTVGNELRNSAGRGLLEPSLAIFNGRYYMTIRAEDGRGYATSSDDGLHWAPQRAWAWDDGTPLGMSTTQQHWMVHGDGLFLVYTRKAEKNVNVFRWRAPIYTAAVDPTSLRLVRASERIVLPLVGDGVNDPKHVARMGNFHVTTATPEESWVTTGECLPHDGWRGNVLLARIR